MCVYDCMCVQCAGCVFKLVEIDGKPRMKLSQDIVKVVIPKKKQIYRLYGQDGAPLLDIMQSDATPPPQVGEKIRARHPFRAVLRAHVVPAQVKPLLACVFDGADPQVAARSLSRTLHESRAHCIRELASLRSDHRRPLNPTPYKISLSEELYDVLHALWDREAPIAELK